MTTLLIMFAIASIIGLRRPRLDRLSFGLILIMVVVVVAMQHYHALYGQIKVE